MRFSVVIPLYNKAPYVKKAIESVLAQTFKDFELIVVDDGSNDGSFEDAQSTLVGRGNTKLIRQDNSGVSIARNNGVAASQGDYLCFLDADDWWAPTFLEEIDTLIRDFPDAGIYGTGYTIINERKNKTRVAPIALDPGFERGYIDYCQVYSRRLIMPLTSISVCIPRDVFEETGGFPKGVKLGEDFILWIHIALKHKVAFVNKSLANYNQDVDLANKATGAGRLFPPPCHMLWNLTDLDSEERVNLYYKQLVDKLRVTGLMPYYLSSDYHKEAVTELSKVDWSKQPRSIALEYQHPLFYLRIKSRVMKLGSCIKTSFTRLYK